MKITILQFKSVIGDIEKNIETAARLIDFVEDSDVIILPELWTTGYYPTPIKNFADHNGERTKKIISDWAKKNNTNIIAGSSIVEVDGKIFNRCIVSNRRGEIIALYDKTHLFSFAAEDEVFSAGNKFVTVEIDGVKCGLAVCYDLRFPEFIRKLALQGTEILFVPAAWSLKRLLPRQILTKARAIENQIFVVFANSAGKSEVINPLGETIVEGGVGEQILTANIDIDSRKKIIASMNLIADRNLITDVL